MQGASPLASPALDRLRHLQSLPSRYPAQREVHGLPPEWQEMLSFGQCRQPRRGGTGGEELRRLRWSSPPGQVEPVPPGFSPGDARGEAPCIRKLKISPFPPGRGVGGWGQQSKLKAGLAGDKAGTPPVGDNSGRSSQCRRECKGASRQPSRISHKMLKSPRAADTRRRQNKQTLPIKQNSP